MRSLPYAKLGDFNLKGKKSKAFMAGKYVEDVIRNLREDERERIAEREKRDPTCW